MPRHSALRCVSGNWQNNAKPLISNGLRFIVTCLPTGALGVLFHCFRHTFATLQLAEGTDIYTVSKLLTHSNLATTQVYADVVDELKRDAAERISLKIPTKEESDQT